MNLSRIKWLASAAITLFAIGVFTPYICARGRETISFDVDWRFFKGDGQNAEKNDFDDSSWRKLNVPHDWSIEGPFDAKNPTGGAGGFLPAGVGWYRKHFNVRADQKDRRFYIEFDGVMGITDVWINGVHLGQRTSGYISFEYDLTDNIAFGKDNVIAVKADTTLQPASRWYTGAGIYRHVRLVTTAAAHIEKWSAFVTTPKITSKEAVVMISGTVENQSEDPRFITVDCVVFDKLGKMVAARRSEIRDGERSNFKYDLKVIAPDLWSLESPSLYTAVISVIFNGKKIDTETVPFGIRSFEFVPATGFWLNGKNFKLKGACLHHDGSAFGAAVPLAVWERRLNELRKLGVNAIRTAHNPPAPEFLDLADRMGFLVMDEMFDQWTVAKNPFDYHLYFNEWSIRDLKDTVRRDRNHPSVILWSAGNEIHDTPKPEIAIPILKGLVAAFHEVDDTRPVTQALFRPNVSHDYENGLADLLDVVGQNYREKEILAAHKQKPTRKIVGTENTNDLNQWVAMRDNPEYSGQFIWVGVDYLGESAAWPNYAYGKGLLDRTAKPRPVGYQRQSWWGEKPMVYIARRVVPATASPTDPGYEVAEQKRTQTLFGDWTPKNLGPHQENAEIYSNCEEVELFLNGKSLGSKPKPKDDSPRNWKVDFEAGTIKAVGENGGKVVAEFELKTVGKPSRIVLSASKANITNDWNDVVFVTATVVDDKGVVVPNANDMIVFEATGAGDIVAVDSADNADHDPFQAKQRRAFQGTCEALIKAKGTSGTISVTANAAGLISNKVSIRVSR